MRGQISQRGKEYLETARTLVRAAQTMTDQHVAGQLKALAEDYERRAEKASHVDAAKHPRDRLLACAAPSTKPCLRCVSRYPKPAPNWPMNATSRHGMTKQHDDRR